MGRGWIVIIAITVLVLGLSAFGYYFYTTGGAGLYRIVVYYLIPKNIPDKKYTWRDFFYKKGEGVRVSGFYAKGDSESVSIWTLSGLKKFYAKPKTSVYNFRDTCLVVRQMKERGEQSMVNGNDIFFDITDWNEMMKKEYFVTVQVLGRENGRDLIDNIWGVSGRYKVLGKVEEGVCD